MSNWGSYSFGVELELIALPLVVSNHLVREAYYNRLVSALKDYGAAAAAEQHGQRYSKHPEHYGKWWITRDGSLGTPGSNRVALESVSPILCTDYAWESDISVFWSAWDQVFYEPDESSLCGCHVHVSPSPQRRFSLSELRRIAFAVVRYESLVQQLLPSHRQDNKYCRLNTRRSSQLGEITMYNSGSMDLMALESKLDQVCDEHDLRDLMQRSWEPSKDRYVLWNFDNILPGKSGTVEFRGGPGVRNEKQTKVWVAFVVAFIHLCLSQPVEPGSCCPCHPDMTSFWQLLRDAAGECGVKEHLPSNWTGLSSGSYSGVDDYNSDNNSIVGKSDFEESDLYSPASSDASDDAEDSNDAGDSDDVEYFVDVDDLDDDNNYEFEISDFEDAYYY